MYHNVYRTFDAGYHDLIEYVKTNGIEAHPRGKACCEVRPAAFVIEDATRAIYTGRSRRLNYRFLAVETLAYIAGWGDPPTSIEYNPYAFRHRRNGPDHADLMCRINKNVAQFVNPATRSFDGAYGPRLRCSLKEIVDLLREDPSSRQAFASVWAPGLSKSKYDVPCTVGLQFLVNQVGSGEYFLDCVATMRSNDLNWGTPYDVAAFTLIQSVIADCLGWGVGKYTHHAGSFHIYDETPPMVVAPEEEEFVPNVLTPVAHEGLDFEEFDFEANVLLKDLLQHLRAERPASEFVSSVESGANGEYWAQWGALVRFKWEAPAPA
jgi:thymidylate synthase